MRPAMGLNPYSNGITIECRRLEINDEACRLNPYSNGITIEYILGIYTKDQLMS